MEALPHSLKGLGRQCEARGRPQRHQALKIKAVGFWHIPPPAQKGRSTSYLLSLCPGQQGPQHTVCIHQVLMGCIVPRAAARDLPLHTPTSSPSESPVGLPNWSNRGLVNHKRSDKNRGCNDSSCKSYSYVLDKCHQQLHWQMWPPHASWTLNSQSKLQSDGNSSLRGPANIRGPKIKWSVWS